MSSKATANKVQAVTETLTIILFLGLLWLPTVDHFLKLDHARAPTENRLLAKWPLFKGIGQSRDFITGIENYFNDHFGFRNRLIRWNNHWKGQLFRNAPQQEVVVGREGWLFHSGEQMIEHVTRRAVWNDQELANWCRLLERRRDWLYQRGIKYLFTVPPDKHSVYAEFLPSWIEKSSKPSKVQQLAAYMKAHSTVEVLDLSEALIEAKGIHVDYFRTDTHWNQFGGFIGYQAVIQALSRQMPGLKQLPVEAYEWKLITMPPFDLAKKMGRDSDKETAAFDPIALKPLPVLNPLYDPVRFPHQGLESIRPCYTLNDKATGRALVFRDSFACYWYSYLGQHFKEVIYIWRQEWDGPLVDREKPDVVIDEIVERFLNLRDPLDLARKDNLPGAPAVSTKP